MITQILERLHRFSRRSFNLCNLLFNQCNQGRHFCDALKTLNKKGTIIPVVVVFIIIISLLSATMLMVSNFAILSRERQITNIQNFYLAEAGITRALYRCRTKDYRPRTQKIENNAVNIIIEDQGSGNYLITSTAGK